MRLYVRFARAVAAFAAGILGFLFFAGNAFEVRVFVEAEPDVRVAGFANRASDIRTGRGLGLRAER